MYTSSDKKHSTVKTRMLAHKVQAVVAEVADADVEVPAEEDRAGVDPAEVDSVIVVEVEGAAVVEAEAEEVEVEVEGEEEEEEVSQNLHSICFYNASTAAKEDSLRAVDGSALQHRDIFTFPIHVPHSTVRAKCSWMVICICHARICAVTALSIQ